MQGYRLILWIATGLLAAPMANAQQPSFYGAYKLEAQNATVTPVTEGNSSGLRVVYEKGAEWPHLLFSPDRPLDWSSAGGLEIQITNPGEHTVNFGIRVDDNALSDGILHCLAGSSEIAPGKSEKFELVLRPNTSSLGIIGLPVQPGMISIESEGEGVFDPHHIVEFQVFLHKPLQDTTLVFTNIHVTPIISLKGVVDRFGQYTDAKWPGKVYHTKQLIQRKMQEESELKAHPGMPGRDVYGGWANGPPFPPSEYFHTTEYDGKWYLVDPSGHLFFSLGMDVASPGDSTFITGRNTMFTWLPPQNSPLAQFYSEPYSFKGPVKTGKAFNFYAANLYRKYGADYMNQWMQISLARLPSWGFNTIGNWSDPKFYGNGRVPYVATGAVTGSLPTIPSGSDYWGAMYDPFDKEFPSAAEKSLGSLAAQVRNDPWCIGYFIDNELSWAGNGVDGDVGLALGALTKSSTDCAAKCALLKQLRVEYDNAGALNAAWGTHIQAWRDLSSPLHIPLPLNAVAHSDCEQFVRAYADQYFSVIRDTLKRLDPNHLYLGCRFAWFSRAEAEEAAKFCDVVSFNIYSPDVDQPKWDFLQKLNKPCIIGEFHFGSLDRGMWDAGLVPEPDQKARGEMFDRYVHSVLDNPAFVGCHWFEYVDEPLTGRYWDGENYNIGFVSVTDTPYPEMVDAARKIGADMYSIRLGKGSTLKKSE